MSGVQIVVAVAESSQVGAARRAAVRLAEAAGFGETEAGKVAIVTTELANNLVRHARGGQIFLRVVDDAAGPSVEILSIDRGPGMADVGRCMQDGFSTGGTSGTGLGAVRRLSSQFDVYSSAPGGTVVFCRLAASAGAAASAAASAPASLQWGVVCFPAPGETICGDVWRVAAPNGEASVMIADGLGHGPLAAAAAVEGAAAFGEDPSRDAKSILDSAHLNMQGTRGSAMAVARIDPSARVLRYAGVGNISGTLLTGEESRGLFSHNGTVGVQIRKVQTFEYPWGDSSVLVMHSDGLQTRWDLDAYPGLRLRHPAIIAAVLYRDFCRGRDDATVLVLRLRGSGV